MPKNFQIKQFHPHDKNITVTDSDGNDIRFDFDDCAFAPGQLMNIAIMLNLGEILNEIRDSQVRFKISESYVHIRDNVVCKKENSIFDDIPI